MSEKHTIVASLSKLAIVRAAFAFLNLGDDGKIESFVNKVIRTLTTEVKIIAQNIAQKEFVFEQASDDLEEKLVDAKIACEHALIDINVDKIATNQAQSDYVDTYLNNLDEKVLAVSNIEKALEALKETYTKDIEELNKQADSTNKRIKLLSATA
jgi:hypothetical protein